jgi:intein/homing endonuclease
LADGSYAGEHAINIFNKKNMDIKNWLQEFSSKYSRSIGKGGDDRMTKVYSEHGTKGDVILCSSILKKQVMQMFCKVDSYTKQVPQEILTANQSSVAAFLRGYFSGDGCLTIKSGRQHGHIISYASVNMKLLDGISILLDRLGIRHHISEGYMNGSKGYASRVKQYKLSISQGLAVNKFMDLVGFIQKKLFVRRTTFTDKTGRPVSIRSIRKVEYVGISTSL